MARNRQSNPSSEGMPASTPASEVARQPNSLEQPPKKTTSASASNTPMVEKLAKHMFTIPATSSRFGKRSDAEKELLSKFDKEVLSSEAAMKTLSYLRNETQEKYLYQIRRYIRHCANKGLDNFFVTKALAKELIQAEISRRGQISENTIKSIRSPLNKLYHMNRIVYPLDQPFELLSDDLIEELIQSYNQEKEKASSSTVETNEEQKSLEVKKDKIVKIGETTKKKTSENEVKLISKFSNEITNSDKTRHILNSLTAKTFKAYSTDIRRFIRYCASQGLNNFLLNNDILRSYLINEVQNKNSGYALARLKNLRSSLLKLNQLNAIAYNDTYHESDLVDVMNEFLAEVEKNEPGGENESATLSPLKRKRNNSDPSPESDHDPVSKGLINTPQSKLEGKLLAKLNILFEDTTLLNGLTEASKRLYCSEIARYVRFCAKISLDSFHVRGEILKRFFIEDIIPNNPNITVKKMREILSRLNRLHQINGEHDVNHPREIPNISVLKEFLESYESNKSVIENDSTRGKSQKRNNDAIIRKSDVLHQIVEVSSTEGEIGQRKSSARETFRKGPKLADIIDGTIENARPRVAPKFHINRAITTIIEIIEEWQLIEERVRKWGLDWIQDSGDHELYASRKVVSDFLNDLVAESGATSSQAGSTIYDSGRFEIGLVIDDYISRQKLSLHDFISKIQNYPTHSKREFVRILSQR
ncbi:predicted protein [Scheffersomyces stipitis CBS 6054]|uniref:Transcription activator GCR1-like domain-containing protein n=1 Tax=Scheffersomyces stipitis (strain ATCC 58785 / CBS 6054 / NBRC 10063 / NRRL Y-11545) TaxID=322104 RepID=A3LPB3_PICST|nr:predicted protein [Scheffersomyces stipitis CBS 6054]ABN65010.2 predicted protein [Scheffersomyces stipitis CBS 6054]